MVSQGMEDYLEAIYKQRKDEPIGTKEIAKELDVKQPSVSEMLRKLKKKNYIIYEKYKGAELTDKGKKIAKKVTDTHQSIKELLIEIGVSKEKAELDACKVEHELSEETIKALKNLLKEIKQK